MNPERRRKGLTKAKRVIDIQKQYWSMTFDYQKQKWVPYDPEIAIREILHNRKKCSCASCGNPRKWLGEKTLQERKEDDRFDDELKDVA